MSAQPPLSVQVIQKYVPAVQTKTPAFGVNSTDSGSRVVVCLSDKAPSELLPLLEAELTQALSGFVPFGQHSLSQYVERLTHSFLTAHVVCGNLRFDKVSQGWRWMA